MKQLSNKFSFWSFEIARFYVRHLGLKTPIEYKRWCNGLIHSLPEKPRGVPTHPSKLYAGSKWNGYDDFLGVGLEFPSPLNLLIISNDLDIHHFVTKTLTDTHRIPFVKSPPTISSLNEIHLEKYHLLVIDARLGNIDQIKSLIDQHNSLSNPPKLILVWSKIPETYLTHQNSIISSISHLPVARLEKGLNEALFYFYLKLSSEHPYSHLIQQSELVTISKYFLKRIQDSKSSLKYLFNELETSIILAALEETNFNKKKTARILGITYRSGRYRIDKSLQSLDPSEVEKLTFKMKLSG